MSNYLLQLVRQNIKAKSHANKIQNNYSNNENTNPQFKNSTVNKKTENNRQSASKRHRIGVDDNVLPQKRMLLVEKTFNKVTNSIKENLNSQSSAQPFSFSNVNMNIEQSINNNIFKNNEDVIEKTSLSQELKNPTDEYKDDILTHLYNIEKPILLTKETFHRFQNNINPLMRSILIDWILDVSEDFKLQQKTLYLAISYLDYILVTVNFESSEFQLLGLACLLVSSKMEEIMPICVCDLVDVGDNAFSRNQILKMEQKVLQYLNFDLNHVTSFCFLDHFFEKFHIEEKIKNYCFYFLEISLSGNFLESFFPSIVALSCIVLGLHSNHCNSWNNIMLSFCKNSDTLKLQSCVNEIYNMFLKNNKHVIKATSYSQTKNSSQINDLQQIHLTAIYKKYSQKKYGRVSQIIVPFNRPIQIQ